MKKVILYIVGNLVFVGLPLLGWGLDDVNGFFRDPSQTIYVVAMLILTLLVVLFIPLGGVGRGEGKKTIKRQRLTVVFLQIVPCILLIVAPYCKRHSLAIIASFFIPYVGLVTTVLGYFLLAWSVRDLGKQFSVQVTIQEGHVLVKDGLYRHIRHPRYLGVILFFLGFSLIFTSLLALLLIVSIVGVLAWRVSDEEKLMQLEFKEEWDNYAANTWRFIPYVY